MRLRRAHSPLARALLCAALAGCGGEAAGPCDSLECETERFFGISAAALPDCEGRAPLALDAEVEAEIVYSHTLELRDVARLTRAAATYYAEDGLSFRLSRAPEALEIGPLIAGSRARIDQALTEAGLPLEGELDAEQSALWDAIVTEILLEPLREFVRERALPPRSVISIVVVEELASPSLYEEGLLSAGVDGLGFSPELFEGLRASGEPAELEAALELPAEFTPTVFLGVRALARFERPDNVVAHELGHALGLLHTGEPGNLMNPEVAGSCRAWLSEAQAASIGATLAAR